MTEINEHLLERDKKFFFCLMESSFEMSILTGSKMKVWTKEVRAFARLYEYTIQEINRWAKEWRKLQSASE